MVRTLATIPIDADRSRPRPVRRPLATAALAGLLWTSSAAAQAPTPTPTATVATSSTSPGHPPIDPEIEQRLATLEAFAAGTDVADVQTLFSVNLLDETMVRERISALEAPSSAGDPGSALAALRQQLLRQWADVLGPLSAPSRHALRDLGQPKTALRAFGRDLDALHTALINNDTALSEAITRAKAGGLLGLRFELDRWASLAEATRPTVEETAAEVRVVQDTIVRAAARLENQARTERQRFIAAALRSDRAAIDTLFIEAVAHQRRLKSVEDPTTVSDLKNRVETLATELETLGTDLATARDTTAAQAAVNRTSALINTTQRLLRQARRLPQSFEQVDVREALAVLLPTASPRARGRAYPLGAELFGELQAELEFLGETLRTYASERWRWLSSEDWIFNWAPRGLLALMVIVLAAYIRSHARRVVSYLVRVLARTALLRNQVGGLVRWAGLFQAIAPVLVVFAAGYVVFWLLSTEHAEVRFIEIAFRWSMIYWLGRSALVGAARRVSVGRPALIDASDEILLRLRTAYNQLGLVLVVGAIVEEWTRTLLVLGRIRATIEILVAVWILGWLLYACLEWRVSIARNIYKSLPETSRWRPWAAWMQKHRLGALLVVPSLIGLFGFWVWHAVRYVLTHGGIMSYLKARALRRQSEATEAPVTESKLPDAYRQEFPMYPVLGDANSVLVPREAEMAPIIEQFERWKASQRDSSLALVGEKGLGKTTLLADTRKHFDAVELSFCTLRERLLSADDVCRVLSPVVGATSHSTLDSLIETLNEGPERAVFIDDAHLSFLRIVDGYRGFDALVELVNRTGSRVFWVLSFNDYAWSFLNAAHGGRAYFRQVRHMKRWTTDELRDLIGRRTEKAGYELSFDASLMDDERRELGEFQLIEGADGFFRLLWEASRGNPRAASSLWLNALSYRGRNQLRVRLFSSARTNALSRASDDVFFALAAIAQHENLSAKELQATLNTDPGFLNFALRFLTEYEVVGKKLGADDRYTLNTKHYWEVLEALHARNLLYREAT